MNLKRVAVLAGFSLAIAWVLDFIRGFVEPNLPASLTSRRITLMLVNGGLIMAALFATAAAFRALKLRAPSL